jgi:general L-amino acid transport system permease protein
MSFIYNKQFRDIFSQLIVVILVVSFLWFITTNLLHNIEQRGITTGFDFFADTAGFAISESPIFYDSESTYFRAFLVGLMNTLIVSVVGIILATVIGLLVGIARLSKNFLTSFLALSYIEIFRNIPILLQMLFWYNVVLAALPSPRQSIEGPLNIFLSNRGIAVPKAVYEEGFGIVVMAIFIAIALIYYLNRWATKKFDETGHDTFLLPWNILIFFGFPFVIYLISGSPLSFDNPILKGFNFQGGMNFSPEFLALTFSLSIYTATYIA